jgi:hypothetical protein
MYVYIVHSRRNSSLYNTIRLASHVSVNIWRILTRPAGGAVRRVILSVYMTRYEWTKPISDVLCMVTLSPGRSGHSRFVSYNRLQLAWVKWKNERARKTTWDRVSGDVSSGIKIKCIILAAAATVRYKDWARRDIWLTEWRAESDVGGKFRKYTHMLHWFDWATCIKVCPRCQRSFLHGVCSMDWTWRSVSLNSQSHEADTVLRRRHTSVRTDVRRCSMVIFRHTRSC